MVLAGTRRLYLPFGNVRYCSRPFSKYDYSYMSAIGLEGESRVLSKRMSSQSIPSADEYLSEAQVHSSNNRMASPRHTLEIPRPDPQRTSAIPRPNYQQPTPAPSQVLESPSPRITPTDPSPRTHIPSGSTSSSSKSAAKRTTRARTQSTPYPFYGRDSNTANPDSRGAMPTPGSSRAASPMTQGRPSDVRPSRIPVLPARARSGSRPTPPNLTVFKDREPTNGKLSSLSQSTFVA